MLAVKKEKRKVIQSVKHQRIKTDRDTSACKGESFETVDTIVLSEAASADFWEKMENPPEPNEYLKEAVIEITFREVPNEIAKCLLAHCMIWASLLSVPCRL